MDPGLLDQALSRLPESVWLRAGAVIAAFVLLAWLIDWVVTRLVARWARRTTTDLDDRLIATLHRPIFVSVLLVGLWLVLFRLELQPAVADKRTLSILGSGSKAFLLPEADMDGGRLLSLIEHQGVVDYRPDELVVTVRAGTGLKSIRQVLARENQMLPFEPPEFRGMGTIGGALAAGLSGCGASVVGD